MQVSRKSSFPLRGSFRANSSATGSSRIRRVEQIIGQSVTFPQDRIDLVQLPLPPAGRQTGTHGREAGRAAGFEQGIAFCLPADKSAGLMREIVASTDDGVTTLAEVDGIERGFFDGSVVERGIG